MGERRSGKGPNGRDYRRSHDAAGEAVAVAKTAKVPCTCGGMNENCAKCWGLGLVDPTPESPEALHIVTPAFSSTSDKAAATPPQGASVQSKGVGRKSVDPVPNIRKGGGCPYCKFVGADVPGHVKRSHGNQRYLEWIRYSPPISTSSRRKVPTTVLVVRGKLPRAHVEVCPFCKCDVHNLDTHLFHKHPGKSISRPPPRAPKPAALTLRAGTIEGPNRGVQDAEVKKYGVAKKRKTPKAPAKKKQQQSLAKKGKTPKPVAKKKKKQSLAKKGKTSKPQGRKWAVIVSGGGIETNRSRH